nr:hypothetical protein [Tanacetum cinerariifolium]
MVGKGFKYKCFWAFKWAMEWANIWLKTRPNTIRHTNLYNVLVESYNTDKDILSTYGDVVTLKRGRYDQDKDEDPSAGSNRGKKRRKSSKDVEPTKGSKLKESKSSSSSKGTQSQPKFSDDQPNNKAAPKHDWFQKPDKPLTLDRAWNKSKTVDFRPPQKWISTIAKEWPAFNLLKGTCKSFIELEYHLEECYKAINDRLDWHNPEGRGYPFDLSKPLSLIEDQGCQVVHADYFIKNNLKYLKGGSSSSKYVTSTTRTKAAKVRKDNVSLHMHATGNLHMMSTPKEESLRMVLHDNASSLEMDYLPKRYWSNLEKKTSHIMIKAMDKLLFKRRLMRNLEKFVGGREYGNGLRMLDRTI